MTHPLALVADGKVVVNDWQTLSDSAEVPQHGKLIVSLDRWQSEVETLSKRTDPVGILLPNIATVHSLDPAILERPLLVLDFPGFADGRAYSQSQQLRLNGYAGDLRATGKAVVLDQIRLMHRCGISSFELRPDQDASACVSVLSQPSQ